MLLLVFTLCGCKTCGSAADAGGSCCRGGHDGRCNRDAIVGSSPRASRQCRPSPLENLPWGHPGTDNLAATACQLPGAWQRHAGPALVLEGRLEGGQTSRCSNALADNREGEGAGQSRWQLPGA